MSALLAMRKRTSVTMPFTEAALGVGILPSYAIAVIDKDGAYHTLLPAGPSETIDDFGKRHVVPAAKDGWPFDYEKAHEERLLRFEQQRGQFNDQQRRLIESGQSPGYSDSSPNAMPPQ